MTFTKEQIQKAMACKTADELLACASEGGVELSREQAEEYIAQLGKRTLTDDELDQVAGSSPVIGKCSDLCVKQWCSTHGCWDIDIDK